MKLRIKRAAYLLKFIFINIRCGKRIVDPNVAIGEHDKLYFQATC